MKNSRLILLCLVWLVVAMPQTVFAQKKKDVKSAETLAEAEFHFTDGMKFQMMEEYPKAIAAFQKSLEIADDPATHYAIADVYGRMKDFAKGLPSAEKAYQADKNNKFYGLLYADLLVKTKRFPEAEKVYKSIIELSPENAEYGVELAAIYTFQNKYDEAIKTYNQVEKIIGVNEEVSRQKQLLYLKQNKIDEAIKEGEKLVKANDSDPDFALDLAELLLGNDRPDQALVWLEKILKTDPSNAEAHVMLAETYRKKGDIQKSNEELQTAFKNPNLDGTTKARILSGFLTIQTPNEAASGQTMELAKSLVKQHPQEPRGYMILGDLYAVSNKKAEARNAYVQGARLDKSVFELWAKIVQLDSELQQPDSTIKHSEEAIEVFPNQALFWYSNGTGYYFKKDHEKAVSSLEEARRLATAGSDRESEAYRLARYINGLLGDAYNSLAKYEKSDEAYEAALRDDPNDDHVLNNYSYFLSLRKDKLNIAVEMAAKLAEKHPTNGTYLDTYAWVLYVSKDYGKARMFLEKAVQYNANNSGTIVEHYGDVLFQLGEKEKAIEQWRRAKTMNGGSHLLDKKIATGLLVE